MSSLIQQLTELLISDDRLKSQDGQLLKNLAQELARKSDLNLIKLLISDQKIKDCFFIDVDGTLIFDREKFIRFITSKQFLPDSYTSFKNKIGLIRGDEYILENKDVILVWPYKDCLLEGGMSKEDQNRNEVYFNEILAPDQINRLLEPKVFTSIKRFDQKGLHPVNEMHRNEKGVLRENLLIKGNNLISINSLIPQFSGRIKLIYLDPPYNTGNDSFKYNDKFNHATWLTFMKSRLECAKTLLCNEGLIFVQCDDNEQAHLTVLMDEIFNRNNFITTMTIVSDARVRNYEALSKTHEFIIVFAKTEQYEMYQQEDKRKEFSLIDEEGGFDLYELRNRNNSFNIDNRPNLFYPFYLNENNCDKNGLYEISLEKKPGWVEVLPAKSKGVQTVWRWGRETASKHLNTILFGKRSSNSYQIVKKYRGKAVSLSSVWTDSKILTDRGTLEIKELFNNEKVFDHPKAEELLRRIIELTTQENDIVLDFFMGSATTAAVSHKLNRQWITIEQIDHVTDIGLKRMQRVVGETQTSKNGTKEFSFDKGGVSQDVGWKGGGDFIYLELAKWNQVWIDKIEVAASSEELIHIWEEMNEKAFLSYKVDPKSINENAGDFKDLSIENQRKFLIECLDKNHLYINYSEIEDKDYGLTEEEIRLNREFYK